jgi:hypothetical protein
VSVQIEAPGTWIRCGSDAPKASCVGRYTLVWDGLEWDKKDGEPISLVGLLLEFRGTRGVTICRSDGTVVVERAGSDLPKTHLPSGRRCRQRKPRGVPARSS